MNPSRTPRAEGGAIPSPSPAARQKPSEPTPASRRRRVALWGLAAAAAIAYPFAFGAYWTDVAVYFGIYVLLGLSLNIILGEVGLFNMGHMAFFAIGAYTTAILATHFSIPMVLLFFLSGCTAAGVAYVLSRPIIHLRGDYLLIATIGLNEIVRITLVNNPFGLTGGPNGLLVTEPIRLFGWQVIDPADFYFLIFALILLLVWSLSRLQHSRIGRAWNYVREDEVAAEAMGVDARASKLLAMCLGAGIAGATGTIYATKLLIISPESFSVMESIMLFVIVVLGGMGSVPGVMVGAAAVMVLPELFRGFAEYRMLIFGAAMVAMMIFRPEGLVPSRRRQLALREDEAGAGG